MRPHDHEIELEPGPPNPEDACMVCNKIICECIPDNPEPTDQSNQSGQATILSGSEQSLGRTSQRDDRDEKWSHESKDGGYNVKSAETTLPAQNLSPKDIRDHVKQSCGFSDNPEPRELTKQQEQANRVCDTCGSRILPGKWEHHKTWCNEENAFHFIRKQLRNKKRRQRRSKPVSEDGQGMQNATLVDQKASQSMELDKVESLSDWYDHHPQSFTEWLKSNGDAIS